MSDLMLASMEQSWMACVGGGVVVALLLGLILIERPSKFAYVWSGPYGKLRLALAFFILIGTHFGALALLWFMALGPAFRIGCPPEHRPYLVGVCIAFSPFLLHLFIWASAVKYFFPKQ